MLEEKNNKIKNIFTPFTTLNIILFLSVVIGSIYFFYIKKDFDFKVQVPCDLNKEQCSLRDCANLDDCPPNGLEMFKRYRLNANDFKYCENEDCLNACESNQIKCELLPCVEDPEMGESCSELNLENKMIN